MRFAWLTDIHLNFLGARQIEQFVERLNAAAVDAFVISGDIGESASLVDYLQRLAADTGKPIYFVLGNHDYYFSSIERVRAAVERLIADVPVLHYLTQESVIELSPDTALVGHDAWSDGRYGDFLSSPVMLNDYVLIRELASLEPVERLRRLNALGDEAAAHLYTVLPQPLKRYRHVFVALHSPPYPEACWHEGESAAPNNPHLPHFSCKAAGDALRDLAQQYPQTQITVLCGHTHGEGTAQILPNLRVLSGRAEYGAPVIQKVFEV
jgi:predicted phosphohydrolase